MNIKKKFEKPRCLRCGSSFVYVRVDGTSYCRNCGYITTKEEQEKQCH